MVYSKKFYKPANSLLESIIALSIISICLYIAIMVYASVFSPKTTIKFYSSQNKIAESFYLMQIKPDSIEEYYNNANWLVKEEFLSPNLNSIIVNYRDSVQSYPEKKFYTLNHE